MEEVHKKYTLIKILKRKNINAKFDEKGENRHFEGFLYKFLSGVKDVFDV